MTTEEKCERLHRLFNKMKRRKFEKTDIDTLGFDNGVYIVFEEGEKSHGGDRIVRVGTHRESHNLQKRLHSHRKDAGGSVFRRKVGCALLNKANPKDPNIVRWYQKGYDFITPDALSRIREQVTEHITGKMSFVAFKVQGTSKEERRTLFWESKLIATIAQCRQCRQSVQWLGNAIPHLGDIAKVKECGMWLQDEIDGEPLTDTELRELERMVEASVVV